MSNCTRIQIAHASSSLGRSQANRLNKTTETTFEALLHSTVRPNHDRNHGTVLPRLVQRRLTEFYTPFFIGDAFGFPFSEKLHAGVTATDGVHHRSLHLRAYYSFGKFSAFERSWRISRIESFCHSGNRGKILAITSRRPSSGRLVKVAVLGRSYRDLTSAKIASISPCARS